MSVYTPPVFAPADPAIAWSIVREHPLGLLLLPDSSVTPLPFLCDEHEGVLLGHLARANPASKVPSGVEVRVIFLGPHAYVSPTWYGEPRQHVPTWNYVVAEAEGTLSWLGSTETRHLLERLCAHFEGPGGYALGWTAPELLDEMLEVIVGLRIDVRAIHSKLKLSQNRSPEDRERVRMRFAEGRAPGPEVAEWMRRTGK